jgi:hypothetical protein
LGVEHPRAAGAAPQGT